jgi:hypothetical protein
MREEILRDNALYTAPNNTSIETFERKEELEKDQLHQTLYLIGLIVSIAIMVICFILLPSINRKARGEMRKSIKSELHELKSLLDDGIITENEFNQKKKQLLAKLLTVPLTPFRAVTPLLPFRHYYGENIENAKLTEKFPRFF